MYGMQHLTMMCGGRPYIVEELRRLNKNYQLSKNANFLYCIRIDFWEPLEYDLPTGEEKWKLDSDIDSESNSNDEDYV